MNYVTTSGPDGLRTAKRVMEPGFGYESEPYRLPHPTTAISVSAWIRTPRRYWKKHPVTVSFGPRFPSGGAICGSVQVTNQWTLYTFSGTVNKAQTEMSVIAIANGPFDIIVSHAECGSD